LYAQTTLDLTVNQVPTAPTVTLSPDPAYTANTLTASATGSTDPDGSGTVTYTYDWYVDGVASSVSTTATFPSADTQKDSTYRVVVTPTDGTGTGPTGEAEVTVDNTAPVLTGPSLSASSVQVGDVLTCTASATDADAVDTPTITYAWSDGSTGSTYTVSSADNPGDTITCTATADDGDGGTDAGTVTATVDNTAPTVSAVSLSPTSVYTNDTLTASVTTSDPDGDTLTVTYDWYVDGTSVQNTTSNVLDGSATAAGFDKEQDVYVIVTADDGTDTATSTSAIITVSNTPPTAPGVTIDPSDPIEGEDLICEVTTASTDADGDAITYSMAWTVDGASYSSALTTTWTDDTVDGADTAIDELWECTATPTDGDTNGTSTTTSARVVSCSDLDCDGYPDLVFSNHFDGSRTDIDSYVYWGSPTGYSSADRTDLATRRAIGNLVADVDSDGRPDIVFANNRSGGTYLTDSYIYSGQYGYASPLVRTDLPTQGASDTEVADLDGDGYPDLVFANYEARGSYLVDSYVYWGSAAGFSTSNRTDLPTQGGRGVAVGDLDQDGYPDIVFANFRSASSYSLDSYIYWGSASGYSASDRSSLPTQGGHTPTVYDLNSDGYPELIFSNYGDGLQTEIDSYIYWGGASGYSVSNRTDLPTVGAHAAAIRDLDNDGYPDIVFGNHRDNSGAVSIDSYIYWGSAAGYSSTDRTTLPTVGVVDTAVHDLNADGHPDIVFANQYDGSNFAIDSYIYWGSAAGYSPSNRTDLPTIGAYGISVAGSE
ncbi:MAG: FG-GAP-like repeat-containing protein, partial [Myxococcota bacterium]|nr:FG-GAP-like repeat-containing protein [Myxococcota bacterium]